MRPILPIFTLVLIALISRGADTLPHVLIITDSVHRETANIAATTLKGRAKVVVSAIEPGDTSVAIERLDTILGKIKWDLIHFNYGFADLRHVDPNTKSVRLLSRQAGGIRVTSAEQYEANLRKIVKRLQSTGSKLVWASTTPIVGHKYEGIFETGSELKLNEIAAKIMSQENIPINDMHAWVLKNVKKFTDPFAFRRINIHEPMVFSIENALKLPTKVKVVR
jgi:lysophospholipase L1-like esterase